MTEEPMEYYDEIFVNGYDTTRYNEIYRMIADIVGSGSIIDIGCGNADLSHFVKNYAGFDYTVRNIAKLESIGMNVWCGDAKLPASFDPKGIDPDYYVCTEVLEHIIDDIKVVSNIPKGSKVIFTVPSFPGRGHVRTFSLQDALTRYKDLIDINRYRFFNWRSALWIGENKEEKPFIILLEGVRI